ncbi:hypothetical protein GH714_032783 [Hevea brasiliensis]|uniref:Uncharacterized protein n=1 Tax=Hevea brasiliensis TaxID=3981 RepID=A0A6A6LKZ8_HEVBR|nr:hypothetical protein GH714_032734 [Hevea brasiliensis]KAF2302106.1 hypothetical protein GH714_032774 [Hevea brasiliensis]KAF2302109.1 hypothetical protein GH714_032783 [Hevea brasiliensis]
MQLGWVIMSAEDGGRGEQEYAHNPSAAQRNPAGCRPTVSNDEFDQENGGYAQVVGTRARTAQGSPTSTIWGTFSTDYERTSK